MHEEVVVVCAGQVYLKSDKKLYHKYIKEEFVEHKDEWDHTHFLSKPLGTSSRGKDVVGGRYKGEVEANENGGITFFRLGDWAYLGMMDDLKLRATWMSRTEAALADKDKDKRVKKDREDDPYDELLKPIREAYSKANRPGRRAILARVIENITRF